MENTQSAKAFSKLAIKSDKMKGFHGSYGTSHLQPWLGMARNIVRSASVPIVFTKRGDLWLD